MFSLSGSRKTQNFEAIKRRNILFHKRGNVYDDFYSPLVYISQVDFSNLPKFS